MKRFNATDPKIIGSTIDREFKKPRLKPPVFKTELIDFTMNRSLEQVLSSLAQPNTKAKNEFREPAKKPLALTSIFKEAINKSIKYLIPHY